jgi:hypothetical protein
MGFMSSRSYPLQRSRRYNHDERSRPLLSVRGLAKHFLVRKGLLQRTGGEVRAVDGISLDIAEGETLGLVGESGCGRAESDQHAPGLPLPHPLPLRLRALLQGRGLSRKLRSRCRRQAKSSFRGEPTGVRDQATRVAAGRGNTTGRRRDLTEACSWAGQ